MRQQSDIACILWRLSNLNNFDEWQQPSGEMDKELIKLKSWGEATSTNGFNFHELSFCLHYICVPYYYIRIGIPQGIIAYYGLLLQRFYRPFLTWKHVAAQAGCRDWTWKCMRTINRKADPSPGNLDRMQTLNLSEVWGGAWASAFLNRSQVTEVPLVCRPWVTRV